MDDHIPWGRRGLVFRLDVALAETDVEAGGAKIAELMRDKGLLVRPHQIRQVFDLLTGGEKYVPTGG